MLFCFLLLLVYINVLKIGLDGRLGAGHRCADLIRCELLRKIGKLLGVRLGALRRHGLSRRRSRQSEMVSWEEIPNRYPESQKLSRRFNFFSLCTTTFLAVATPSVWNPSKKRNLQRKTEEEEKKRENLQRKNGKKRRRRGNRKKTMMMRKKKE